MLRQPSLFWLGLSGPALALALGVAGAFALHGCASNPVAAANTLDQKAYAIYGTFVIVEEQGAKLVSDPTTPAAIKAAIRSTDARAKPTADALTTALHQYDTAVASVKAGGPGTAGALSTAQANLTTWIAQASTDVNALVAAVKGNASPQGTL